MNYNGKSKKQSAPRDFTDSVIAIDDNGGHPKKQPSP
jgi:hypothetical protein